MLQTKFSKIPFTCMACARSVAPQCNQPAGENNNDNVGVRPRSQKNMLATRAALGCLHQGLGHGQYEGLM